MATLFSEYLLKINPEEAESDTNEYRNCLMSFSTVFQNIRAKVILDTIISLN